MHGNRDRSICSICLKGVALCLLGLSPIAGCSKVVLRGQPEPTERWICDKQADEALKEEDYQAGILLHERFLEKDTENALSIYHLGYAYGQVGNHVREVSYYERAIALGFLGGNIFFNLGMAYGELDQIGNAIRAFKKGLDVNPDSADNHFGLAMAYRRSSADTLAEKEFLKAIEIDSEYLDARLYLSELYLDRGEVKKARQQLIKTLEIDPSNLTAIRFLEGIEGGR